MFRRIAAILFILALLPLSALADGGDSYASYGWYVPDTGYNAWWIIPDSDSRELTEAELWRYSRETLRYIRNEILARAGYAFSTEKFYIYFNAKPWYMAGGYGTSRTLSRTAWANITAVKAVEKAMDRAGTQNPSGIDIRTIIEYQDMAGGFGSRLDWGNSRGAGEGLTPAEANPALQPSNGTYPGAVFPSFYGYTADYIIPDSNIRDLTESELWGYTREALRYIRNEILARHGYAFNRDKFASYFGSFGWYVPGGYDDALLSGTEWRNISLIKKVEKAMDDLGTENNGGLDIAQIIRFRAQNAGL